MKRLPLLYVAVVTTVVGQTIPVKSAPAPTANASLTVPPEVLATTAPGAVTVHCGPLPIRVGGVPVLMHAWRINRRGAATSDDAAPSLACIDLFTRVVGTGKKWELASTVSYPGYSSVHPGGITYAMHWLHPPVKRGFVIVEETAGSTGASFRLLTFPQGINGRLNRSFQPHTQEFQASYSGGGRTVNITFERTPDGRLTVRENILPHAVAPQVDNIYTWNTAGWVKTLIRTTKQR
ncbi:MAG TPA: hypothetical protein VF719_04850 [Abditibacteriaceae bacterium]|jgi:hypothetical protein